MSFKKRILLLVFLTMLIVLLGVGIQLLPDFDNLGLPSLTKSTEIKKIAGHDRASVHTSCTVLEQDEHSQLPLCFNQAAALLHAKKYKLALPAFVEILSVAPKMPEAHVNMGFTLVGLEQYLAAKDFFITAIELKPEQANAYYGLSLTYEGAGDYKGAVGAMRTYIHRTYNNDPYLKKARAALWEWEQIISNEAE
tara:strand:+ start:943 stop:1527 length:585 start_codon:yes stop_codon:yes gene_type:complete